jgi:transposase-like protein
MGAELLADMTADLDGILERFRQDLAYVVETLGMRPAARRLGVSPNSLYHWTRTRPACRLSGQSSPWPKNSAQNPRRKSLTQEEERATLPANVSIL